MESFFLVALHIKLKKAREMRRILFPILLLAIACVWGCKEEKQDTDSEFYKEVESWADSLRDTQELLNWMQYYEQQNKPLAALIVRQVYGKMLRDRSNFEAAIHQHDTCITLAKELGDTLQLIVALNNQGTNLRRVGDIQGASNLHYTALELSDKLANDTSARAQKNIVRSLNGLGNVFLAQENYDAAEEMFHKALSGEKRLGSATGEAINLANLGSIKRQRGELDSAHYYYTESMRMNEKAKNQVGLSLCYQNLGLIEKTKGNDKKAIDYFRHSYAIGLPTGDVWHWLEPCTSLAAMFLDEHQTDSASHYIDQALEAAMRIHSLEHLQRVYSLRSQLNEDKGLYQAALEDLHTSKAYSDSVALEKSLIQIQNLRVKYESDRRVSEVRKAEEMAASARTVRNVILWSGLITIGLAAYAIFSQIRATRERKRTTRALQVLDMERKDFYLNITHQLGAPITSIIGMIQRLRRFLPKDDPVAQEEFNAIDRQSLQLLKLTTELQDYTKGLDKSISQLDMTDEVAEELLRQKYSRQLKEADGATEEKAQHHVIDAADRNFLEEVDQCIKDHLTDSGFGAGTLATYLHKSTRTLNSHIKEITGVDTTHYIMRWRMNRAKYLVEHTDMSMGEIQALCGFDNAGYFSRTFKEEFQQSPSEYRKSIREVGN